MNILFCTVINPDQSFNTTNKSLEIQIKNLKTKREFVMNKYSYYSQKLIKLNKNDKIKNSKYKG